MQKWKIPLYKVMVNKDDKKIISRIIDRGTFWAMGPEIEEFETALSNYIGTKFCVSFNSGTSALHGSLISYGIGSGDHIAVPSFTFIATVNSPLMVNAVPQFIDIEEKTLGLDPEKLEKLITKKTKAIIPIHYGGLPCQIDKISSVSKITKKILIEDAAEAIGSKFKNKKIGTFGDSAIFSFAGNKVITTGEGGAVITNSEKIYKKLKLIRSHGRLDKQNYFQSISKPEYVSLGYNWRMSSITAALGIIQLSRIDTIINLRRKKARALNSKLKKIKEIIIPQEPKESLHTYQMYPIRLANLKIKNKLMKFLEQKRIMTKIFFHPVHLSKFYKNRNLSSHNLSITEKISDQILCLPIYPDLKTEEINYICNSISEFFEKS